MKKDKLIVLLIIGIIFVCGMIYGLTKLLSNFDVIGKDSLKSFKVITEELKSNITYDEKWSSWALKSPDDTVTFYFSKDFSKSVFHDVMLEFDSAPFISSGLDISKLPNGYLNGNMIMVGTKLGTEKITYNGEITPYKAYEKIVKLKRSSIKYHAALDHYGIDLGNGNMFEWAKDININGKDIIFVLNPEPFIKAGVNPNNVEGWLYTKVPTMKNGKKVEVYKFLKPFNLSEKEGCSDENNICKN